MRPKKQAGKKLEKSKFSTLNIPIRVYPRGEKNKVLDLSIVTPKLENHIVSFTVDSKRKWTP